MRSETTKRLRPAAALAWFAILAGCSPTLPVAAPQGPAARPIRAARSAPPAPPRVDLRKDVLLTVRADSLDELLRRSVGYIQPQLPAPLQALVDPARLKAQLFQSLRRLPGLVDAVATDRPWAAALLDPKVYPSGGLGPVIVAVPVRDPDQLLGLFRRENFVHRAQPWGDHRFGGGGRELLVRFREGYALLAAHERALHGAEGVLVPLLRARGAPTVQVRLDVVTAWARHGVTLRSLQQLFGPGGPAAGQRRSLAKVARAIAWSESMREAKLALWMEPQGIRGELLMEALDGGALHAYLGKLNAGPLWGAAVLPGDAAVAVLTRKTRELQVTELEEAVEALKLLAAQLPVKLDAAMPDRWRSITAAVLDQLSGEQATAFFVDDDGSPGFVGAYRAKGAKAREATLDALRALAKDFGAIARAAARQYDARGLRLEARIRPRALRVGGLSADVVEFAFGWPRVTEKLAGAFNVSLDDGKAALARYAKAARALLGARPKLALVVAKDRGGDPVLLVAGGKHCDRHLKAALIRLEGRAEGALHAKLGAHQTLRGAVGLAFVPVGTLARQVHRALEAGELLEPRLLSTFKPLLPAAGQEAPFVSTFEVQNRQGAVRFTVAAEVVGLIAKAALGYLQHRMGVSGP